MMTNNENKNNELLAKKEQIAINEVNGRTRIVFKRALLEGKVSSNTVLSTILMAAQMQAEKLIEKLSRGAPLDAAEVKMLKELAEITKLEVSDQKSSKTEENVSITEIKSTLYAALTEKLTKS